jgi:WD40 repeat protein/serine/threonine protein kinase
MNTPHSEKSERELRLDELITAYLKAVESGEKPNREEWLAQHPELASDLAAFFDAQDQMDRLAGSIRAPDAWNAPTLPPDQPDAGQSSLGVVRYFGDYELLKEIARGGMGVVYKARQVSLNRIVALKMILAGQLASAADVQRFRSEAEAAANLDHPNIVPIYEVGEHEGQHYFSMKFVEGGSLSQGIRSQASGVNKERQRWAARLLATVARAVHHAHQRGILHRDLKPSNILLDVNGEPHVTDFGLAKRIQADSKLTQSGAIVGTPSYMAPEQARSERVLTTTVDVYSLGAILYELLTGRPPFQAATPMDTLLQVIEKEPSSPHKLNPQLERDLETICLKCLEKDPARRYDSAAALAIDLERWLRGEPIAARPSRSLERTLKWARRHPAAAILAMGVSLGVPSMLILTIGLWYNAEQRVRAVQKLETLEEDLQQKQAKLRKLDVDVEQAIREADRNRYFGKISLAEHYWLKNNVGRAEQLLDECLPDSRAWEWRYLKQLCKSEARRWPGIGAVFSSDGKRLLIATQSDQVELWDTTTWKVSRRFSQKDLTSAALSHDGTRLALAIGAFKRKQVKILDTGNGQDILNINEIPGEAWTVSVEFSPDGRLIATAGQQANQVQGGSRTAEVILWDARTGKLLRTIPEAGITLAFDPDSKYLAVRSDQSENFRGRIGLIGSSVKVVGLVNGQVRDVFSNKSGDVDFAINWSPDGKLLACGRTNGIVIRDAENGNEVLSLSEPNDRVICCEFSPDSKHLLSAGSAQSINLWDLTSGKLDKTYRGHAGTISSLSFHPNGKQFVSSGGDGTVRLWEVNSEQRFDFWPKEKLEQGDASLTSDGALMASTAHLGYRIPILSCNAWDSLPSVPLIGTSHIVVNLSDARTGEYGRTFAVFKPTSVFFASDFHVTISGDGKRLAYVDMNGGIHLFDVITGQELHVYRGHRGKVTALAFSHDGNTIASASSGQVSIWNGNTGRDVHTLASSPFHTGALAFGPNDKVLAVVGMGKPRQGMVQPGEVFLYDLQTGAEQHHFTDHTLPVVGVAFSPDGSLLATASWDQTARIWNLTSGKIQHVLRGHTSYMVAVAFTPDGERLASSSFDKTVKLWDPQSGQEVISLPESKGQEKLYFLPAGELAAVAPGQVEVWHAPSSSDQAKKVPSDAPK